MTVIAWDGITLAADKLGECQGLIRTTTKIRKIRNNLVGIAGAASIGMEMFAWIAGGEKKGSFPESQMTGEDWAEVLVIRPGGLIFVYERTPYPVQYDAKFFAIGAGADFAVTAMYLGKDAYEAVRIACYLSTQCGCGVDELRLKPV